MKNLAPVKVYGAAVLLLPTAFHAAKSLDEQLNALYTSASSDRVPSTLRDLYLRTAERLLRQSWNVKGRAS